jgi:hypothetical protein
MGNSPVTYFKLNNKTPVECSLEEWTAWFSDTESRRVAFTDLDKSHISTVFVGMGGVTGFMEPLLFETMVFDKDGDSLDCERTATWNDAMAAHEAFVEKYS